MITVSTTSPAEARYVFAVLEGGLPREAGFSVYLNGALFRERGGRTAHPGGLQAAEWPSQAEERL